MATCPAGHESATSDYCDECGAPMTASEPSGPAAPSAPSGPRVPQTRRCVVCDAELDARFCETCGHDSTRPAPPPAPPTPPGTWSVVATADSAWFAEVRRREGPDIAAVAFPQYCPPRTFVLVAPQMTIGRRSRSRGIEPEIDLTGPPLDPGVSTLHAVLLSRQDGGWDLVDVGSTNGTVIDGAADPIAPNVPVPLAAGDRIKIGAWTVLTVEVDAIA